jgi:hypothetical protein
MQTDQWRAWKAGLEGGAVEDDRTRLRPVEIEQTKGENRDQGLQRREWCRRGSAARTRGRVREEEVKSLDGATGCWSFVLERHSRCEAGQSESNPPPPRDARSRGASAIDDARGIQDPTQRRRGRGDQDAREALFGSAAATPSQTRDSCAAR